MRKLLTGIILGGVSLLALSGCTTTPAPAPTVTVTATVTAAPPAAAPLAAFTYKTGDSAPSATFTVPSEGYVVTATCTTTGSGDVNYTTSSPDKANYGGIDHITCDGKRFVDVQTPSDLEFFDLGGKKLTLAFPEAELTGVTSLQFSVVPLDL